MPSGNTVTKRILVINPNTSAAVTELLLAHCRRLHADVEWLGVTSRIGAPYIATEVAYALAAHAVLEAYAEHVEWHDAVFLACFGDPGLQALQEIASVPVIGLAQSSFLVAGARGPFAVVTGGHAWKPMLQRFARAQQLDTHLTGIHTVALSGAQMAASPKHALELLVEAAHLGVAAGASSILLGGAALAGMAPALQSQVPIPVLDNVALAAQAVVDAVTGPSTRAAPAAPVAPGLTTMGVGAALAGLLRGH